MNISSPAPVVRGAMSMPIPRPHPRQLNQKLGPSICIAVTVRQVISNPKDQPRLRITDLEDRVEGGRGQQR